jgi:hypothetical protein
MKSVNTFNFTLRVKVWALLFAAFLFIAVMIMDREVAKPHTYGLPPGWTGSMMGMMTLVRVLPPTMYDEVVRRIREGITELPAAMPGHKHGE